MSEIANNEVEVIDLTGLSDSSESDRGDDIEGGVTEKEESDTESSSDASEIEITLNEETRAQLQTAIATVSERRLRQLLKLLVESDVMIEATLTRELVTLRRGTQDVVPRWETCAHCDAEFDINTLREDGECVFHPGELVVSEVGSADWDTDCHGPIDTLENRRKFPENFTWTCCQANGSEYGCLHDRHKPLVTRKRKRIED
ncbi:hypothetical protein JR316_0006310 [Psilocybe cubensis]|uniref:Uncharacterized protein n=2 Tax=Psilocybe cubensis TaxID=181762 RepID=A0A8H7Y183_PSICU|nr:hypothetical protein JR316_0006310 [Psilocybe cubensis]KAH9481783.1 hypothetical protein JR316_0006310 [Psilocybe cubensis]